VLAQFEEIVGDLDYPMFIVTVAAGDEMSGCLVGFSTQCSIDPFRFVICLSKKNRTCDVARRSECMAVHIAPAREWDLATLFGGATGDEIDKFSRCTWAPGPGGVPVLDGCPAWFAGPIIERWDGGDHIVHMLEATAGRRGGAPPPLTFQDAQRIDAGHEA
jgi:flavin reductase (DIM6/NTAB) family NADH-FMN oxidoreductase RutF